jgi:YHS domain-containing protein
MDCTVTSKITIPWRSQDCAKERNMPVDPVCGMDVDEKATERAEYEGQTYYFCSRDCKEEFESSPEDYIGDELEQTGT